ncbi:hypothetical protein A0U40_03335 [[Bacillus] sp. KCTC 13219]|nr:hypothetical protein A0U40_03335 [[Bacillus] sp. KCTC 13219]
MSLISLLEEITLLKHYTRYEGYESDPNYDFEIFALSHFNDLEGNLKPPHYLLEKFSRWIPYIEQRALTTNNKILRSRYNDLLWIYKKDFDTKSLKFGNIKDKCQLAIDDYISLANSKILKRSSDENLFTNLKSYLFRAWSLAKQIRSPKLNILVQLMIEIENSMNEHEKIGMWGFSFRNLIKGTSIIITEDQEQLIIQKIIYRLSLLESNEFPAIVHGVEMLLDYYKSNTIEQEKYLDLLEVHCNTESKRPLEIQHRCEILISLCHKYNFKERKERAIIAYHNYGKDVLKHMVKFEKTLEITPEMKKEIIDCTSSENHEIHLLNICYFHLNKKKSIKNRLLDHKQSFAFKDLFQTALTDEEGVTIKTLENEEDELFHESKLDWQIQTTAFYISIQHFIEKHNITASILKDLLYDDILYKGFENTFSLVIQSYFEKNFIAMSYVSIPLIERGLRQILFLCDRSIYEDNKHNGFENITLTRILKSLEEYLSEDLIFFLKFSLNEKAGLNIRNNLTHGLLGDTQIGDRTGFTLLHILIALKSLVGFTTKPN